jgi:hypothetical protein
MNCTNCKTILNGDEKYCPNCGQKNSQGRLTTKAFLKESWNEFLRFDKRFFRTLFALLIPGRLTNEVIDGRRARYIKPIRLYIGFSILMLAIINMFMENPLDIEESEFENLSLTLGNQIKIQSKSYEHLIKDKHAKETLETHNNRLVNSGIISYDNVAKLEEETQLTIEDMDLASLDSMEIIQYDFYNQSLKSKKLKLEDITSLNRKELYNKYGIDDWLNKKLLTQNVRFIKQGSNFFLFLMQKVGICILFMIPFLALFLKLVYIRSEFYYSEHLSFSLHTHSFLYLLISILFGFSLIINAFVEIIPLIGLIVFPLYLFFSLKLVYKQNVFKTTIKFIIINIAYLALACMFSLLLAFLSFLLF